MRTVAVGGSRQHPAAARTTVVALLVGLLLALTGCVQVPTSGPAEKVEGPPPPCQNCVNVEVAPPAPGDTAKQVVQGFLRATAIYQPNYTVAKQFLTTTAAETWSSEDGARIYTGVPTASGRSKVVLDGRLEGSLTSHRSYISRDEPLKLDFGVVKENGEWRISTPPNGLMIDHYSFSRFYSTYDLYFIGNGSTLVPDPIYLPNLPSQANVVSVLMKALLQGASDWLLPAVTTALPADTDSVDAVTVQDGVAQVPLSDSVLTMNDSQRSLLAAQVVYTLEQSPLVKGVVFKVNQKPFRVPESDDKSFEVAVDQIPPGVAPVPFVAGDQLYAVRGRTVEQVNAGTGALDPRPVSGQLGKGRYAVDRLAISVSNTDIAVVTDDRTVLRSGLLTADEPTVRLRGVTQLLRPQFTRYDELWEVGTSGGRQRMWMFSGDKQVEVASPLLDGGRVTAFRISPDGTRMAVVRSVHGQMELGLARISRTDQVTVDGWTTIETAKTGSQALTVIRDVGWSSATDLLVLGAPTRTSSVVPYQVSQDGSEITPPTESNIVDGVEVTTLLRNPTSVIIGRTGRTFKFDGSQYLPFVAGCRTMAFPG